MNALEILEATIEMKSEEKIRHVDFGNMTINEALKDLCLRSIEIYTHSDDINKTQKIFFDAQDILRNYILPELREVALETVKRQIIEDLFKKDNASC